MRPITTLLRLEKQLSQAIYTRLKLPHIVITLGRGMVLIAVLWLSLTVLSSRITAKITPLIGGRALRSSRFTEVYFSPLNWYKSWTTTRWRSGGK